MPPDAAPCGCGGARPRGSRRPARRSRTARRRPARGRPAASTNPPTVSKSPSSISTPSRSVISPMPTFALKTNVSSSSLDDRLGLAVVLVANLADEFLDHVLDRDEARGAAVLVDHHGELKAPLLELPQQVDDALGLRHERGRAHDLADRARPVRFSRCLDQVLHHDESDDVVEVLGVHRQARVLLLADEAPQIVDALPSAWIATMSGRGVMTSRTSVSPKSTTDRSSRFSSPDSRGRRLVGGRALAVRRRTVAAAPSRDIARGPADDERGERAQDVGDRRERRQQQLEQPLGRPAHDERRAAPVRRRPSGQCRCRAGSASRESRCRSPSASSTTSRTTSSVPRSTRAGTKNVDRIVEVGRQRLAGRRPLGLEALRQPHQQPEGRFDQRQKQQARRRSARQGGESWTAPRPGPGDQARPAGLRGAATGLRGAASRPGPARDRSPGGAATRAAPESAVRSASEWPLRGGLPAGDAQRAMAISPKCLTGKLLVAALAREFQAAAVGPAGNDSTSVGARRPETARFSRPHPPRR